MNIYPKLNVIDTKKRYFSAWATIDVKDTQGDRVNIEDFEKFIPVFLDRIPPLTLEHSNRIVGKVINAYPTKDKDGVNGIMMVGRVYEDTNLDNSVWEKIKNGIIKGVSIGGEAVRSGGSLNLAKTWEIALTERPANQRATLLAVNHFAKKIAQDMPPNAVPYDDPEDVPAGARTAEGPSGGKYYIPAGKEEEEPKPKEEEGQTGRIKEEEAPRTLADEFHVKIVEVGKELNLPYEVMVVFEKQVFEALRNYDPKKVIENENRFMNILRAHARKLREYSDSYISKNIEDNNVEEKKVANMNKTEEEGKKPEKKEEKPQENKEKPEVKEKQPVDEEKEQTERELPPPPPLDLGYDDSEIKGKIANLENEITRLKGMVSPVPPTPESDNLGDKMEEKPEETTKSEIKKEASMEEYIKSSIEALNGRLENIEKSLGELKAHQEEVKKNLEEKEEEEKPQVQDEEDGVAKTPEVEDSSVESVSKSTEINWDNANEWKF